MSQSLIPNGSKPSKTIKTIRKILNGLGIYSDLDWFGAVTFLAKKSAFYGNLQDIAISLFPAVPVKRIDIRMHSLSVMLH